jgi:hypothetical protein
MYCRVWVGGMYFRSAPRCLADTGESNRNKFTAQCIGDEHEREACRARSRTLDGSLVCLCCV